jgi:hypothetical protein
MIVPVVHSAGQGKGRMRPITQSGKTQVASCPSHGKPNPPDDDTASSGMLEWNDRPKLYRTTSAHCKYPAERSEIRLPPAQPLLLFCKQSPRAPLEVPVLRFGFLCEGLRTTLDLSSVLTAPGRLYGSRGEQAGAGGSGDLHALGQDYG